MLQLIAGVQADEAYPDVVNIVVNYTKYGFFCQRPLQQTHKFFGGNITAFNLLDKL